jgi:hypothetical protein
MASGTVLVEDARRKLRRLDRSATRHPGVAAEFEQRRVRQLGPMNWNLSSPALLSSAVVAVLCGAPAAAQTTKLISTGDVLPGLGTITALLEFDVNAAGDWVASVQTAQMPLSWNRALVRNGVVVLKPGDIVQGLPFVTGTPVALDGDGNYAWTSAMPFLQGMWLGTSPCLLKDDPIVGAGVPPDSLAFSFFDLLFEPAGTVLVNATMVGASSGLITRVLVRTGPHGSGVATSILKQGDFLPGHGSAISYIGDGAHSMALDAAGDLMYTVRFLDGVEGIYRGNVPLALTGQPSPVLGVNWGGVAPLAHQPVELNDSGDYAFTGLLDAPTGFSQLLVRNGSTVTRQGDALPAIAPYAITKLGGTHGLGAPVRLTQDGRVLWLATWNDPDTARDSGLFLDHELVVQEGVTHVGGVPIDEFSLINGSRYFDISANGTAIYVHAKLANGQESFFVIHPAGSAQPIAGCVPNSGTLTGPTPTLGSPCTLSMGAAQVDGALALLFLSTKAVAAPAPCGLSLPDLGEILIDFVAPNPIATRVGASLASPAPTPVPLGTVPNSPALSGLTFYAQGVWIDTAGAHPVEPLRLTNALAMSVAY